MNCKFCGSENPEEAKFCLSCGKKLSGWICPACQTENAEEAIYCYSCGTRLDGKVICAKCGAELPKGHSFCTQCGEQAPCQDKKNEAQSKKKDKNKADVKSSKTSKILHTVSLSVAIALAAISVIFTIFMGSKTVASGIVIEEILVKTSNSSINRNLFYYFGQAYEDLSLVEDYFDGELYSDVIKSQIIFGTIICAATLIATITLAAFAILKCTLSLRGKEARGGGTFAIGAFMAFVAGSACLFTLTSSSTSVSSISLKYAVNYRFNGATIAGFTIGGVLMFAYLVLNLLTNPKERLKRSYWANGIFVLSSAIIVIIILSLLVVPTIRISYTEELEYLYNNTAKMKIGLSQYQFALFSVAGFIEENKSIAVLSILAFVFVCYAIICAVWMLLSLTKNLCNDKPKGSWVLSIQLFASSITAIILTAVASNKFFSIVNSLSEDALDKVTIGYAPLIVAVVFAAIVLAVQITHKVLEKKLAPEISTFQE